MSIGQRTLDGGKASHRFLRHRSAEDGGFVDGGSGVPVIGGQRQDLVGTDVQVLLRCSWWLLLLFAKKIVPGTFFGEVADPEERVPGTCLAQFQEMTVVRCMRREASPG